MTVKETKLHPPPPTVVQQQSHVLYLFRNNLVLLEFPKTAVKSLRNYTKNYVHNFTNVVDFIVGFCLRGYFLFQSPFTHYLRKRWGSPYSCTRFLLERRLVD